MNKPVFMKSPPLYFEFTRHSLTACLENDGAEFPLERQPDGRLTASCRGKLAAAVKQFLKARGWPARAQALCAIDGRGVSLRCLTLPAVNGDGLGRLVRMQIESEFPLSPEELAWGFRLLGEPQPQPDGTLKQAVLVAAVKKEVVGDYAEVLTAAGITAVFTVAALVRTILCPQPPASHAVLELGVEQSELAGFEETTRAFVRVLPCGTRAITQSGEAALEGLVKLIRSQGHVSKLYIFGDPDQAALLARRLEGSPVGEPIKMVPGAEHSAAILGMKKFVAEQGGVPMILQLKPTEDSPTATSPVLVEWGARALLLLLAVLLFPWLEALFLSAPLSQTVSVFKAKEQAMKTTVDAELDFLQYLKQNQPPYLESYYVLAKAAPAGIHLESLALNRHGEMALRGSLRNGDQVADFRSKLIASGFFASVTVEEQSPTPDHQKVNIRMTAQWKPPGQLQALALGPAPAELGGDTNSAEAAAGPGPAKKPVPGPSTNPGAAAKAAPATNLSSNLNKGGTNQP